MRRLILSFLLCFVVAGCGQRILVFDGLEYGPDDNVPGLLIGPPMGDRIEAFSQEACAALELRFFPDFLIEPTIALYVPPGCTILLRTAEHPRTNPAGLNNLSTYRFRWLSYGEGSVTPILAGVADNSVSELMFDNEIISFFDQDAGEDRVTSTGTQATRVSLSLARRLLAFYEGRIVGFEEGELATGFSSIDLTLRAENEGIPYLDGILIQVPRNADGGYYLADLTVSNDVN